jgi:hypothetical protein
MTARFGQEVILSSALSRASMTKASVESIQSQPNRSPGPAASSRVSPAATRHSSRRALGWQLLHIIRRLVAARGAMWSQAPQPLPPRPDLCLICRSIVCTKASIVLAAERRRRMASRNLT